PFQHRQRAAVRFLLGTVARFYLPCDVHPPLWNEFAVCGVLGPSVALASGVTTAAVARKVPTDKAVVRARWPGFNPGSRGSISVLALLRSRGHLRSSDLQAYLRFETISIIAGYARLGMGTAALQGLVLF